MTENFDIVNKQKLKLHMENLNTHTFWKPQNLFKPSVSFPITNELRNRQITHSIPDFVCVHSEINPFSMKVAFINILSHRR